MKVGDLVEARMSVLGPGLVMRIDKDFYGARNAFKTYPVARGKAVRNRRKPDFIAKTAYGIRDRVLVLWIDGEYNFSYEESTDLEVISVAE